MSCILLFYFIVWCIFLSLVYLIISFVLELLFLVFFNSCQLFHVLPYRPWAHNNWFFKIWSGKSALLSLCFVTSLVCVTAYRYKKIVPTWLTLNSSLSRITTWTFEIAPSFGFPLMAILSSSLTSPVSLSVRFVKICSASKNQMKKQISKAGRERRVWKMKTSVHVADVSRRWAVSEKTSHFFSFQVPFRTIAVSFFF